MLKQGYRPVFQPLTAHERFVCWRTRQQTPRIWYDRVMFFRFGTAREASFIEPGTRKQPLIWPGWLGYVQWAFSLKWSMTTARCRGYQTSSSSRKHMDSKSAQSKR